MTDFAKTADSFLALCAPERRERCARALDTLAKAAEGSPLYNVDFKDAKDTLNRAVEMTYQARVSDPFLRARGWNPEAALDCYLGLTSGLHCVPSKVKKLGKLKPESELSEWRFRDVNPAMVAAVREVLAAAAPLAEMVKELSGQVVKGRKPEKPSAAREAMLAKEAAKMTCPCCFRAMALDSSGNVVKHGWRESGGRRVGSYGNTWHVGQCFGTGYAPYEVSCQGTKDFEAKLLEVKADLEKGLATLKARPAKLHGSYTEGYGRNKKTVSYEVEDDGGSLEDVVGWRDGQSRSCPTGTYAWNLNLKIASVEGELRMLQLDLNTLAKAIADWKPAAA